MRSPPAPRVVPDELLSAAPPLAPPSAAFAPAAASAAASAAPSVPAPAADAEGDPTNPVEATPVPVPAGGARPEAQRAAPAAPVAERSLTALLVLLAAVLVFLAVHRRVDRRDAQRADRPPRVPALPVNVTGGGPVQLTDRLAVVQWLRCFLAAAVLAIGVIESDPGDVGVLVAAYVSLTVAVEVVCRRAPAAAQPVMSWMLLLDGVFLALALAFTGGADSWVRVLVFFDVTAVTLVVSYRTGLKLAVWDALLLFLGHAAAAAHLFGSHTTGSYGDAARSHRRTSPLALVVLDLDHFKDVNDTVGHQAVDAVLREVARAMVGNTKASDLPARYGGDEFVVLLPDCTRADAIGVAERLRAAVAAEVTAVPVTVSAGVGAMPENAGNGERLVAAADAALYAAKREGRDRSLASNRTAVPGEAPAHPALRRRGRARHGA